MPARSLLTKYIQPLAVPGAGIVVATPSGMNQYAFTLLEIARQLHPNLPPTPFWAYDDGSGLGGQAGSFGMAVVAQSGIALDVSYTSNLPEFYPDWIPVDTRLTPLGNHVRMMTHLHGGFVNADSDGNPAIMPNGFGPGDTQIVHYSNQLPQMPASVLWFHDHGLVPHGLMFSRGWPQLISFATSTTPGRSLTQSVSRAERTKFHS